MKNPINKLTEKLMKKEASAIDKILFSSIPKWKARILRRYPTRFIAKLLNINILIEKRILTDDLGYKKVIYINNIPVGEVKSVIKL